MQYYNKKSVGKRIKILRKQKKMTQSELADYLDYTSERQLQRIENGETACAVDKLMEIAQILETSTDFLLFGVKHSAEIGLAEYLRSRSRGEQLFVQKLFDVVVHNINLLIPEEL